MSIQEKVDAMLRLTDCPVLWTWRRLVERTMLIWEVDDGLLRGQDHAAV